MSKYLPLPLGGHKHFRVYGGPYRQKPKHCIGVKMAAEINAPHTVSIPTRDFQTPRVEDVNKGLQATMHHVLAGSPVYVGCMGGIGRTGLLMALLAKAFGVKDPVGYVREHYHPHAVETTAQRAFVESYEIAPGILWRVRWAKFRALFSRQHRWTRG